MGQRCSCLGSNYSLSPTEHDDPFTSLRDGGLGQDGRRGGSGGVELLDMEPLECSVATAEIHIHRLERFLPKAQESTLSWFDTVELIMLVRRATESLGSNATAKADLYQKCLKMCPSGKERIFRNFFLYNCNGDILEELLSRGRPVLDIQVFGEPEAARETCDLSQYALKSDTDRRAAMLTASEVLFSSLMPLKQPSTFTYNIFVTFRQVRENGAFEQLILRTMQACNKSAALVLGYFLTKFYFLTSLNPKGLLRVFKCLVALGFDPSLSLQSVQHIEGYRACVDYWRSQPQLSLQHLARVAVRDAITTNVVHAAPRLGLPASLQSYLLLEDALLVPEIGEAMIDYDDEFY